MIHVISLFFLFWKFCGLGGHWDYDYGWCITNQQLLWLSSLLSLRFNPQHKSEAQRCPKCSTFHQSSVFISRGFDLSFFAWEPIFSEKSNVWWPKCSEPQRTKPIHILSLNKPRFCTVSHFLKSSTCPVDFDYHSSTFSLRKVGFSLSGENSLLI